MDRTTCLALLLTLGCTGAISDAGAAGGGPEGLGDDIPPLISDEGLPHDQPDSPRELLRLTPYQYVHTVGALLPSAVVEQLADVLARLPESGAIAEMDRLDNSLTLSHVRAYRVVAERVGTLLADSPPLREELFECLGVPITPECADDFVRDFAPRALRRPLTEEEFEELKVVYEVGAVRRPAAGIGRVVSALMQRAEFLFHVELSEPTAEGDYLLQPHELANRLAYTLTGAPPDDALRAVSDDGFSDAEVIAEVERLSVSAAARRHFRHFARQWLELDRELSLVDTPESVRRDADLDGLMTAAQEELLATSEHVVFEQGGGLQELLTTNLSVLRSESLAHIYGVSLPASTSGIVELPDERRGLLTRAGVLLNDNGLEHPIHRGALILREFACDVMEVPDVLDDDTPELVEVSTTRDVWQNKTAGGSCQGCHARINPVGFALSDYDGLGRYRTHEDVLDELSTEVIDVLPVNAEADVRLRGREPVRVVGGRELGAALAETDEVHFCVARRWFEFSVGQHPADRSLAVASLAGVAREEGILAMIKAFVLNPDFRRRSIDESEGEDQ